MKASARALDRICVGCLGALAFALPFELVRPLWRFGPVSVTNVEAILYVAIAVGIAAMVATRSVAWTPTPVQWAVIGWIGAIGLSAATASTNREAAIKFALRTTSVCLLCLVVSRTIRTRSRAMVLLTAVAGGAIVSAALGVLALRSQLIAGWLGNFRDQAALIGGVSRATGTFDYATTAAMYWEAALPATVCGAAWAARRWSPPLAWAAGWCGSAILVVGIVLSLSRAAVATSAAGLIAIVALGWRDARLRWATAGLGILLAASAIVGGDGLLSLRFASASADEWYRPEYRIQTPSTSLDAGSTAEFGVHIRNDGPIAWSNHGRDAVALNYYWEPDDAPGAVVRRGEPIELPAVVQPGGEIEVQARVQVPTVPGRYRLHWDLLLADAIWLSAVGGRTGNMAIEVQPRPTTAAIGAVWSTQDATVPKPRPTRAQLWRTAWELWRSQPVLGVGPDNFRHLHATRLTDSISDSRTHTNSLYLETLANLGMVGVLALTVLFTTVAVHLRQCWRGRADSESRVLVTAVGVALAAFAVHGVVDYFLIFTATSGLFWLLVGIAAGLRSQPAAS